MTVRRSLFPALTAALVVVSACGSDSIDVEVPDPVLSVVSGTGQSQPAGEVLDDPFVVQVTQGGVAVAGVSVSWSVTSGGGSVDPATSTTGSDGRTSTTLTLGATAGANTVQASASGVTGSPQAFTATGTSSTPPATANVSVIDNAFDPDATTVAAGGTVTWTWNGASGHNVTFPSGSSSSTQASGTFSRAFPAAGTFDYQCTIHAGMNGTVTVQ